MATTNDGRRQLAITLQSIVLGIAVVAGLFVLGQALVEAVRIRQKEQRITVTGSATRRIRSDFIVWEAKVRSQDPALTAAYKKLAADVPVLVEFIKAHGIKEADITVLSTTVQEVHPRNENGVERPEIVAAYVTEQVVKVKSAELVKVEQVSREATQLIDRGLYVHSDAPLYIYTKLAELKIKMLAEASADAKLRAEQIANNTGARLGGLLNARMGVLQVNPEFSTEVSWEGNNDKTTLEKDVLAIVTASFGVH
jgi:uncharacterized protein